MTANANLVPTTELEAVNLCLAAIGEAPVNSLTVTGLSDETTALQKIREASLELQTRGWSFNQDRERVITRTVEGEILQPSNALHFDVSRVENRNGVIRGGKLYDVDNNTFVWDRDLKCDVIYMFAFDDLPAAARWYIAVRASRLFARATVGSRETEAYTADDEQRAWILFRKLENRAADRNVYRNNIGLDRSSDYVYIPYA
jgi:hypothetical protein